MPSWPARPAARLVLTAFAAVPCVAFELRPEVAPVVRVGLVSRRSFCRGSFVVLERKLEDFTRHSDVRRLIGPPAGPVAAPVDATIEHLTGLLKPDVVALLAVREDGTPILLVEVPDVPRAQLDLWDRVEPLLER